MTRSRAEASKDLSAVLGLEAQVNVGTEGNGQAQQPDLLILRR